MKTMTVPAARRAQAAGWRTIPAAAGVIYALAWVTGLLIAPASLRVTAPGTEVISAYAGHQAPAIAQVVLAEGVAGLALAVVVVALSRGAWDHGAHRAAVLARIAGLTAAVLSLAQCALGVILAGPVTARGDSSQAGEIFGAISRIDGVKMLLLAVVAVSVIALARRAGGFPAWVIYPSGVLAVTLTGSGFGYLLLSPALAWMAYLSLPVLLIWVAGAGVLLARAQAAAACDSRPGPAPARTPRDSVPGR